LNQRAINLRNALFAAQTGQHAYYLAQSLPDVIERLRGSIEHLPDLTLMETVLASATSAPNRPVADAAGRENAPAAAAKRSRRSPVVASKIQTWSHMASASRARRYCSLLRLLTLRPTGLSSPAYRDLIDYIVIQDNRAVGLICEDRHTLPDLMAGREGPEVVR
jgi:hypothetical protein